MAYHLMLGKNVVGTLGPDNTISYDETKLQDTIQEIFAGQGGSGSFFTTARVVYRWDRNRKLNNDAVYNMWKANPLVQNRIVQLNALVFGRGIKYLYSDVFTQQVIDRFWRTNRIGMKMDMIGVDTQLYGEIFFALFPQPTGDVKMVMYESNQVDIDFEPDNVHEINKYVVTYKDEENGKDETIELMPIETFLNEIEFTKVIGKDNIKNGRRELGLNGIKSSRGKKGVMLHIQFNSATSEVYGTSDFKQIFDIMPDYMNFVGDRLTIHQLYGSPSYDITIDTDDPNVIMSRINELAGFTIGSNPVHNKSESWQPLQFSNQSLNADKDESMLRGLISAGMGFPEHLLFNQTQRQGDEHNTFSVTKLAENRQTSFKEAFTDMHKYVVAIAGGDPAFIDEGQIIFPEVDTMSEKSKAETYVLKVGAQIVSRKTAATNMGHNWMLEESQIIAEQEIFGALLEKNSDAAGSMGGRFTSKVNNQDPNRDDGTDDKNARLMAQNITTQVAGNRKENN